MTAAAALLLLAPAGAAARGHDHRETHHRHAEIHHKHGHPGPGCRVRLSVAPRLLTAGESALAYGQLTCDLPSNQPGQTVTLYRHSVGSPGFGVVGTSTTDEHGFYAITASSLTTNSAFYVVAHDARSATRVVRVAAQVTLVGPAEGTQILTSLRTGRPNRVTFTGTVTPPDAGALVVLQRQNALTGNDWHRIQLGRVNADGSFSIAHVFRVPGDANIRVLVRSHRRNVPSVSNVLNYQISQAQNPELTIASSQDPISYGQSVTISGTAAGAPNMPMTLLAHTRHGRFSPVAQVTTDASGNYAFPPQSPVASTFYRVQGAGKSSAVLYEGVKDVLTAQVSATTIAAGQPLTFTGTVTPDHTGHVIYLERQNASGTAFHVVEVATIGAGSTYSITHTLYAPGTGVFRVKVPGDPQNGGTVSENFTITVTPPAPSTLTPEAPGNSTQPSPGHS
ncbi:MAG TPA: Ig-like domain-containing protein [Solirubrobacteraceae bacterium]|nr:Ig-like domain-containing protein [Solirubrobacteraceae bacterium]